MPNETSLEKVKEENWANLLEFCILNLIELLHNCGLQYTRIYFKLM